MVGLAVLFGVGLLGWSLVEYGIHGLLSHRFSTPVSPLHWQHHREPDAVFTAPIAWVPGFLAVYAPLALLIGVASAAAITLGVLVGFVRYEYVHWRIHFREPETAGQKRLREHHLAHHFRNPKAYCGVTTRFWDRVFGTLPADADADYAAVADWPKIEGPSNLRSIWNPRSAVHRFRTARGARGAPWKSS